MQVPPLRPKTAPAAKPPKKSRNRDRAEPLRYYQSIAQAAGQGNIPVDVLRRAKAAGCPNFHGSRIRIAGLTDWISANADQMAKASVGKRDEKLDEEIRKLKLRNDLLERKLIPRSEVAGHLISTFGPALSRVEQLLCNEYPLTVSGLDIPQARIKGKVIYDMLLEAHRLAAEKWKL